MKIFVSTAFAVHQFGAIKQVDVEFIFNSNTNIIAVFDTNSSNLAEESKTVFDAANFGADCVVECIHKSVHLILSLLTTLIHYTDS
jgi:hypothetical protein